MSIQRSPERRKRSGVRRSADELSGLQLPRLYQCVSRKSPRPLRAAAMGKPNSKSCGNAYRPSIADEDGGKIRAVATSDIARIVDVHHVPTLAALVVFYS